MVEGTVAKTPVPELQRTMIRALEDPGEKSTDGAEKPVEKRPEKRRKVPRYKGPDRFAQKFVHKTLSCLFSTFIELAPGYRPFGRLHSEGQFSTAL